MQATFPVWGSPALGAARPLWLVRWGVYIFAPLLGEAFAALRSPLLRHVICVAILRDSQLQRFSDLLEGEHSTGNHVFHPHHT